jgi:hypothetical protein
MSYQTELVERYKEARKRMGFYQPPSVPVVSYQTVKRPEPVVQTVPEKIVTRYKQGQIVRRAVVLSNAEIQQKCFKEDPTRAYRLAYSRHVHNEETKKTFKGLLSEFCREANTTPAEMFINRRTHALVRLRWAFWFKAANELPHMSLVQIGRRSGSGYDHTTIIHALRGYSIENNVAMPRRMEIPAYFNCKRRR